MRAEYGEDCDIFIWKYMYKYAIIYTLSDVINGKDV